ncbi:unnamed protein product [Moneuplotes crassus]|uniref:Flavin-containing monooxygenase n=1 Tax=Euplotes crassus TaxID=5936 RepID=A0AAD1X836_EUPCR|nr:unnamed protein product [Moneuplotes crassus]
MEQQKSGIFVTALRRLGLLRRQIIKPEEVDVKKKKVCIIGAGPVGLAATRHFKRYHDVDTYEARDKVGGLWYYDPISELTHPNLQEDEYYKFTGYLHPSIYENMTANLPKYLMQLKDFPHKEDTKTMMEPNDYLNYLTSYYTHFNLSSNIHLNTLVLKIRPLAKIDPSSSPPLSEVQKSRQFLVMTKNTLTKAIGYETYDHIVCAQGRNSRKFIPKISGQESWDGLQLHMHEFRKIDYDLYKDKIILIMGTNISAYDYVYHVLMSPWKADPKKIYITGTTMGLIKQSSDLNPYVESGKIEFLTELPVEFLPDKEIKLENGRKIYLDILMYATGYKFNFPFLCKEDQILDYSEEEGRFIYPGYKRILSARYPNFSFCGMVTGSPFPLAGVERQILFSLSVCNDWVNLPSTEEMIEQCDRDIELKAVFMKKKKDKVFKFDYVIFAPKPYAEDLRQMINRSGKVYFKADTAFDIFDGVELVYIEKFMKGDYLSAKQTDFEQMFEKEIAIFKQKPPSAKYF